MRRSLQIPAEYEQRVRVRASETAREIRQDQQAVAYAMYVLGGSAEDAVRQIRQADRVELAAVQAYVAAQDREHRQSVLQALAIRGRKLAKQEQAAGREAIRRMLDAGRNYL